MTAKEMRQEAVRLMKSRAGKNSYTQARPAYFFGKPEGEAKGYSDCSSSVAACILRAAGISIGGNTSAQVDNAKRGKGIIVDKPAGNYFDEKKLQPGDALYFRGNTAHTDAVGHVEMYTGSNECYGHGSGIGPTKKNLKNYCAGRTGSRKALYAVRWIKDDVIPDADKPGEKTQVRITGGTVNVRKGAGTNYAILGVVKSGEKYPLSGKTSEGWYGIIYKGAEAWVSAKYAEVAQ